MRTAQSLKQSYAHHFYLQIADRLLQQPQAGSVNRIWLGKVRAYQKDQDYNQLQKRFSRTLYFYFALWRKNWYQSVLQRRLWSVPRLYQCPLLLLQRRRGRRWELSHWGRLRIRRWGWCIRRWWSPGSPKSIKKSQKRHNREARM